MCHVRMSIKCSFISSFDGCFTAYRRIFHLYSCTTGASSILGGNRAWPSRNSWPSAGFYQTTIKCMPAVLLTGITCVMYNTDLLRSVNLEQRAYTGSALHQVYIHWRYIYYQFNIWLVFYAIMKNISPIHWQPALCWGENSWPTAGWLKTFPLTAREKAEKTGLELTYTVEDSLVSISLHHAGVLTHCNNHLHLEWMIINRWLLTCFGVFQP